MGNDYITMLAFLKKIGIEYSQIPMLKPGQKPKYIVDGSRIDKFISSYSEKAKLAKLELENKQNERLFVSHQDYNLDDLLEFFQVEGDDDGVR